MQAERRNFVPKVKVTMPEYLEAELSCVGKERALTSKIRDGKALCPLFQLGKCTGEPVGFVSWAGTRVRSC